MTSSTGSSAVYQLQKTRVTKTESRMSHLPMSHVQSPVDEGEGKTPGKAFEKACFFYLS